MNNNQLWKIVIGELDLWASELSANYGVTCGIARSYNKNQQSIPSDMMLYIYDLGAHRYGFQGSNTSMAEGELSGLSTQQILQPYQIKVLESPQLITGNVSSDLGSYDVAQNLAMWMQTEEFIYRMAAIGFGIDRITDVTNLKPKTNSDRYQPEPTFDFTLNYTSDNAFLANPLGAIKGRVEVV